MGEEIEGLETVQKEEEEMVEENPPQERRLGFLLIAFLLGALVPSVILPLTIPAYIRSKVQAEAVKAGHAVYKVVDEFGRTEFQWTPTTAVPVPEKK